MTDNWKSSDFISNSRYFKQHSPDIVCHCSRYRGKATGLICYIECTEESKNQCFFIFYDLPVGDDYFTRTECIYPLYQEFIESSSTGNQQFTLVTTGRRTGSNILSLYSIYNSNKIQRRPLCLCGKYPMAYFHWASG